MTRLYATFDPAALGPALALEQANTVLVTTATADINRTARVLYGKQSWQGFGEFAAWGDASISNAVSFGVVTEDASLSTFVGGDAEGFGYRVAEGAIYSNGASIATVAAGAKGDVIGIWLQIGDGSAPTATWFRNGIPLHTQSLPSVGPWYLAATISSPTADSLRAWINTGQRAFEFPVPGVDGWYELPPEVPALRVSTVDFIAPPDDVYPNEVWESRIESEAVEIVSSLVFWPDNAGRSTQGSAVNVPLLNSDGALDWLLQVDVRDLNASLKYIEPGDYLSASENIASMIVDDVQAQDAASIRLTLTSSMSMYDQPLQTMIFPPSADPVVAGKPWPISLGAARQTAPVLIDPVNRIYAVSDRGVPGWGYIRDMGAPLDPNALPPGYVILDGARTIQLETEPVGKLTADVSSTGGGTLPSLADDIWDEDGNPFAGAEGSPPTGFDVTQNVTIGVSNTLVMSNPILSTTAKIGKAGITCLQGRSYRYRIVVVSVPRPHVYGTPVVSIESHTGIPQAVFTSPGTYEGTITAAFDFSPRIVFSSGLSGQSAVIRSAYILEIPDVYTPANINAITLTDFIREIVEVRFGKPASSWSRADTEAIDAATGYAGIGFNATAPMTVRAAIDAVMTAYTCCAWVDENDVLRFTRLAPPEDQDSEGEITDDDMLAELTCRPDLAPGLSTQVRFRKNWEVLSDTDFVTDFLVVTMAVRRALSQPFQGIAASSIPLGSMYRHAVLADPVESLLDMPEDAQAEIDHVVGYYATPRYTYTTEISDEIPVRLGQIRTLKHSAFGLAAGKNVLVSRISRRPISGTIAITLRG